jgi:hypothetical protein
MGSRKQSSLICSDSCTVFENEFSAATPVHDVVLPAPNPNCLSGFLFAAPETERLA